MHFSPLRRLALVLLVLFTIPGFAGPASAAFQDGLAVVTDSLGRFGTIQPGEIVNLHVVVTDLPSDDGGMTAIQFGLDIDPRLIAFDRRFAPEATLNFEVEPGEVIVGFGECIDAQDTPFVVMSMRVLFTGTGSADDLVVRVRDLDVYGESMRLTRCDDDLTAVAVADMGGVVLNPVNQRVAFFGTAPDVVVQGREFELGWASSVVVGLERDGGSALASSGVRTYAADEGDTFVLRRNGTGDVLAEFTPDVIQRPRFESLTGEPVPGSNPPMARVEWEVSGANAVYPGGAGAQPAIGGAVVAVQGSNVSIFAVNEFGSTSQSIVIEASEGRPAVLSFTADATNFAPGSEVTLSWSALDADVATIEPGVGTVDPVSGSVVVHPTGETTYTLTLSNENGAVTQDLTLSPSAPIISFFELSSDDVVQGDSIAISWIVEAADELVLDPGGLVLDAAQGEVFVYPDTTVTAYTLTATNSLGEATETRDITVSYTRVNYFRAVVGLIYPGDGVLLEWDVTPGSSIVITPEVGPVSHAVGNRYVHPTVDGQVYTLTATRGDITVTATTDPIHFDLPAVSITVPDTVYVGHPFLLQIETAGCDSLRIDPYPGIPIGVDPDGLQFLQVNLPEPSWLVATGFNPAGATTDSLFVDALAHPSPIAMLSAPSSVFPNEAFELTAFVDFARSATLTPLVGEVQSGTETIRTVSLAETTEFTLFAESAAGTTIVSHEVSVVPPTIAEFRGPDEVFVDQEFLIYLRVDGATSIDLEPYDGDIALGTTGVRTSITETTEFVLTATNAAGSTVQTLLVRTATPDIRSFSASQDVVVPGETSSLEWDVVGAHLVEIYANGIELVATELAQVGSLEVSPDETTTYTLRASNSVGTSEHSLVVESTPIRIDSFTASRTYVEPGTIVVLAWEVSGEGTVLLQGFGNQPLVAQFNVYLVETTTYVLVAQADDGTTQVAEVTVEVPSDEPNVVRWSWSPTGDDSSPPQIASAGIFEAWIVIDNPSEPISGLNFGVSFPGGMLVIAQSIEEATWTDQGFGSRDFVLSGSACVTPGDPYPVMAFQLLALQPLDPDEDFLRVREVWEAPGVFHSPVQVRRCDGSFVPGLAGPDLAFSDDDVLPAVGVDLQATAVDGSTLLTWTWDGGCADRVAVLRRRGDGTPELVANLVGEDACGSWTAPSHEEDETWQVVVVTTNGSLHSTEVRAEAPRSVLPSRNTLLENVPNPFNPATDLRFSLRESGPVSLEIFDTAGRRVRRLDLGERPAGEGAVTWRGRDQAGRTVSSGVYLVRMVTRDGFDTRRILLLK